MRIQFSREGGFANFPGLNQPVTIDTAALSPTDAATLERLVGSTRFFDQSSEVGKPPSEAADYHQYTITIEDGARQHTVRLSDPVGDPNLQELVNVLQRQAATIRAAARQAPRE